MINSPKSLDRYKAIVLPLVFIVSSLFILIQVLIPSFSSLGDLRKELSNEKDKLSKYQNSVKTLKSLNDEALKKDLEVVSRALPTSKDIQGIYLALTNVSLKSGVALRGFTVNAGAVYNKNEKEIRTDSEFPSVRVEAELSGLDAGNTKNFSDELNNEFPLSKITSLESVNGQGKVTVEFYYRPYDLTAINNEIVLPVSDNERKILDFLSSK
jgi:hypothetical protein